MFRAAASVVMLLGFYVVALIQLVAVLALVVWVSLEANAGVGIKLGFPLLLAVGATVVGLWRAIRTRPEPMHGLVVSPEQAPELWNTVRALAAEVGTRTPDEIRLVPEVNAAVSEDTKLLGLIGGRRRLYLGMPLVQALSVDQMRSVVAHELGHYSGRHTRLGAVAYRGRLAIGGTVSRIGRWNPVGMIFRGYARLYLLVDNAASRRQELDADRASVRVAGPEVAMSALRELPVVDAAWDFYFGRYVAGGWEAGYAPDDFFGGFGQLFAARGDELAELRDQEPEEHRSRWDTHPSTAERIAVMRTAPQVAHPVDGRPAAALLPSVREAGIALQREVVDVGNRQVLPWPQFTAAAATARLQRNADRIFRSLGRLTGAPDPGLGTLFDLVAAGRLGELAEEFFPGATRKEAALRFAGPMDMLFALAAVRSGTAFWRHSWSGPARLTDAQGAELDFEEIAKLAVSPATIDEARARLAERGVHVEAAGIMERKASASGSDVIAAMANLKVDGAHTDLVLLDRGFLFVPGPKSTDHGKKRLQELLGSAPVEQLAARHRFVPFEEVRGAAVTKRTPVRADLRMHDGTVIAVEERWTGEQLGDSRETLLKVLDRFARETDA
ncbi:M48 family metalloprotease [Couchioplanes caeruleus]|uniref:M48 family metallopeptidase n=1 Tax=Couchioplanes caeruleus TaxID=56438 RepID=UPI00201BB8FC|nr:M48 family metallopeptidase [Couchioplanes caeruleus]UQU65171.1 M48 family metalloprotease [Couchioplanes caeruleus]